MAIDIDTPRIDGRTKEGRAMRDAQRKQTMADFGEKPQAAAPAQRARPQVRTAPAPRKAKRVDDYENGEVFYDKDGNPVVLDRAPARTQPRQAHRDPVRQVARRGRVEVQGRNGERLTRKRVSMGDPFEVTPDMVEPGWAMQWIAHTVHGNSEVVTDQNLAMTENGWRPVDASRFPGKYMPVGYKGHIIRGGQGLYERPQELTDEARREEIAAARQLISDRNESLKLTGMRKQMGSGFEMNQRYRGTGGAINITMDRNVGDIPQPDYQLAGPED